MEFVGDAVDGGKGHGCVAARNVSPSHRAPEAARSTSTASPAYSSPCPSLSVKPDGNAGTWLIEDSTKIATA